MRLGKLLTPGKRYRYLNVNGPVYADILAYAYNQLLCNLTFYIKQETPSDQMP